MAVVRFFGRTLVGCVTAFVLMWLMIGLAWLIVAAMNEIWNGFDGSATPINGAW